MPSNLTYPGVYIEEVPSGVRTLTGVATSVTAFIGRASRGPTDWPVTIFSFADFERTFGGLSTNSAMSYAVRDFYLNGGGQAVIVRITSASATAATTSLDTGDPATSGTLTASSPGEWGENLTATVEHIAEEPDAFNLVLADGLTGNEETFLNVVVGAGYENHPRFLPAVLDNESNLARMTPEDGATAAKPDEESNGFSGADDGDDPELGDYDGSNNTDPTVKAGLYALENTDIFNLLCVPDIMDIGAGAFAATAVTFCEKERAMLLIDSPSSWRSVGDALAGYGGLPVHKNAAVYFPRLIQPDPLRDGQLVERPPCGAIAGVFARTDAQRGIWKAPAGINAIINGTPKLSVPLTDNEIGQLNPLGINCLKNMPPSGRIVWGARTRVGADQLASEWKYVPIRRLALNIEESLYRGTQWVVFEPNDEPLWSQIRLNVGAFMNGLFRKGAFQGSAPADAYFVKCDSETTTQADINLGIVNIIVGFAPLKPAEFVIIKLQQIAGQLAA